MQHTLSTSENLIDSMVSKIIHCGNCFMCCKNSSAFVLSHEVDKLKQLGVPLHEVEGVSFISPTKEGFCPNLTENKQCAIYEDRPTSCKLFPFYLMNRRDSKNQWVVFNFCPNETRLLPKSDWEKNINVLRLIALEIEKNCSQEQIEEMKIADKVISKIDRLEVGAKDFTRITSSKISMKSRSLDEGRNYDKSSSY